MTTVTMPSGITYHRGPKGWRQDCGIDMPERDWRWLDRIADLEAGDERLRGALLEAAEVAHHMRETIDHLQAQARYHKTLQVQLGRVDKVLAWEGTGRGRVGQVEWLHERIAALEAELARRPLIQDPWDDDGWELQR